MTSVTEYNDTELSNKALFCKDLIQGAQKSQDDMEAKECCSLEMELVLHSFFSLFFPSDRCPVFVQVTCKFKAALEKRK